MAVPVESLDPSAYLEAMASAARVLGDHAVALDDLERSTGPEGRSHGEGPGAGSDLAAGLSGAVARAEDCRDFAAISAAMVAGVEDAGTGAAAKRLARLLSGMGDVLANIDRLESQQFALALEAGAERLAPGDDGRHPGGFAAVVGVAADAALSSSDRGAELGETILAAAGAGIEELERGPLLDPRLAALGSVDAASAGVLLILDTLASVVTGEPLPERPEPALELATAASEEIVRYEVTCRLIPESSSVEVSAHLEERLVQLADLTRWEVGGDSWSLRMLTAAPGTVVEALVEVGRPRELRIAVAPGSDEVREQRSLAGSLLGTHG